MTSRSLDLHQTSISSKSIAVSSIDSFESTRTVSFPSVDFRFESSSKSSIEALLRSVVNSGRQIFYAASRFS
jgi:hypothetical protein